MSVATSTICVRRTSPPSSSTGGLLGGIIEERYGAFGTFSGRTGEMQTGYSRKFTFDPRMARGVAPPYFPTVGLDEVSDTQTLTFGHREQVY